MIQMSDLHLLSKRSFIYISSVQGTQGMQTRSSINDDTHCEIIQTNKKTSSMKA